VKAIGWTIGVLAGTILLGYAVYRGLKSMLPSRLVSLEAESAEQAQRYLETMSDREDCIIAIAIPAKKEAASVE